MSPIMSYFVYFLLIQLSICAVKSLNLNDDTQNFGHDDEAKELEFIRAQLKKINKPSVKTIHSPDGDIIDCVLSHKQPAFDHPLLKGQKPLDPPDHLPSGYESTSEVVDENLQIWNMSNETCPEGTVAIRRTTEQELLMRARSIKRFGGTLNRSARGFEHAIGFVTGDKYYGASATMNVWAPHVAKRYQEHSGAQLRIMAGELNGDLNTIEAGWQVFWDDQPRLFIHWTKENRYHSTGCYNLECPGFVHTSKTISLGSSWESISSFNGSQMLITLLVWKEHISGNWWLQFGREGGRYIGYWPSELFTHLNDHADHVEFGGEVWSIPKGSHTTTQMGSGHFAEEGFKQAAYFRDINVVDEFNNLNRANCLRYFITRPNCYDLQPRTGEKWETYFFFGGPGKNPKCLYY